MPGKIKAYFTPVFSGGMTVKLQTTSATSSAKILHEPIDDELIVTLNEQEQLEAEVDSTGDEIEDWDSDDIESMADFDLEVVVEEEVCFDKGDNMEDCESENKTDVYVDDGEQNDLDDMEVC
jgi:hypothetical protein